MNASLAGKENRLTSTINACFRSFWRSSSDRLKVWQSPAEELHAAGGQGMMFESTQITINPPLGEIMPTLKTSLSQAQSPTAISRRRAIGRIAGVVGAAAAPLVLPARLFGDTAPSKRITLGFVGLGGEGYGHNLKAFLVENDARAVAVCDVMAGRRRRARKRSTSNTPPRAARRSPISAT